MNYFNFYWENPLKTYKKISSFFLPLYPKINIGFNKGFGPKIFNLTAFDVTWKDKFDSPRHEWNPRILFSLFNYLHINITFKCSEDEMQNMFYWESALWWLYYKNHLPKALDQSSVWVKYEGDKEVKIKVNILKEPWQSLYNNKKLPKIYYEDTI